MFSDSYSLGLVLKWVKEKGYAFKYASAGVGIGFTNHGIRLALGNEFELSIQTHTDIVGSSFAETALFYKNKMVYILAYEWDVCRWNTPDDLFTHIEEMLEEVKRPDLCDIIEKTKETN